MAPTDTCKRKKGQYFQGGPRNIYNPQPQLPGNRFPQQFPQPNTAPGSQFPIFNQNPPQSQLFPDRSRNNFNPPFQPPGNPFLQPARQENLTPRPQSSNFNPNPQNIPNFSFFHPSTFPVIPEQSTLFPQRPTLVPPQNNQPTPFAPTVLHNPTYNPQRQNSNFPNPMQSSPIHHGLFFPSSMFTIPQSTTSFFKPTQQTRPPNPSSSFLFTPSEIIHPSTLRFTPNSNKPIFTGPQQNSPIYTNPQQTAPTVPGLQQTRPISPQSTPLLTAPTGIIDPSTLKFIEDALKPGFNFPKQTNPNYNSPQGNIPTPLSPPKSSLDSLTPQQQPTEAQPVIPDSSIPQQPPLDLSAPQPTNTDLTVPQQLPSDSVVSQPAPPQQPTSDSIVSQPAPPQQPAPDTTVSQQNVPDSSVPQQTDSGSLVPPQADSDSKIPQQTDSDPIKPPKTVDASDSIQPMTSASEPTSSISNVPQDSGSESPMPQQPVHTSHNHSLTSQYIPHPENQGDDDPLGGLRIVCLFNNRHFYRNGFTPSKLEPHLCTHLNYEFAILDPKTYEMIVGEPDLDIGMNFYQEAIDLRGKNPELKILVSLGGWSDSTKKYSELAKDPAKRANFVDKAVQFLKGHKFDGMDLAWEYPNCWQGAIGINPSDKQNFVALLKDIKEGFKKEGLLLSVSVGAIKREVEAAYNVPAISNIVDYINVMTYDMHGPWESKTGHHVQFEAKPGDKDPYTNVKGGMKVWIEKGADKKKLNMGLALYGRTFRMKNSNQCEMGAPAVGPGAPGPITKEGGILNYHEICKFLNSGDWTEKLDREAGFYACSGDQWAGYDPPMMMVRKVSYVVNSDLGGVLLKDLSGDDSNAECFNMPFPILRMVKMQIMHKVAKKKQKNSKHNV